MWSEVVLWKSAATSSPKVAEIAPLFLFFRLLRKLCTAIRVEWYECIVFCTFRVHALLQLVSLTTPEIF